MNQLAPLFTGLSLLLSACSGSSDANDGEMNMLPSAGSLGEAGSAAFGGNSNGGSGQAGSSSSFAGQSSGGNPSGGEGNGGTQAGSASMTAGSGGSNAGSGGATPMGGSGGAGGSTSAIDYSIWVLQLPTGSGNSVDTISSADLLKGYSSAYFYAAKDGGQIFMDPKTGITTSGSQHCRTEMRESAPGGGQAAWSSSGTNTLTVSGEVLQVGGGSSGTTTVGQLFNGTDSIPLVELQYSSSAGGFKMLYEEAKGGGTTTNLNTAVALNTKYSYTLALNQGVVTVSINGKVVHTQTPSASALSKKFYFKVGNYDQTASMGAISTDPYTVVEVYSVSVVHQ
ncbi:MAG TPA: polysaccharide lyase family 7 protein [Polyangiaceae bacterium]|jgi:hypothetical protein|nr:polysaccharide lyase family 7 protein [Polyangiaceae bacterium]